MTFVGIFLTVYFAIGLLFGLAFMTKGYAKIDHAARSASKATRLMWLPASIILWPILMHRWLNAGGQS